MEVSVTWQTYSRSSFQEIPRLVWNLKVHHRVHKSQPLYPVLTSLVHILKSCYFNIHLNISLSILRLIPQVATIFICTSHLLHACYMSSHLILLYLIPLIVFSKSVHYEVLYVIFSILLLFPFY
jgi:hypothetical protein